VLDLGERRGAPDMDNPSGTARAIMFQEDNQTGFFRNDSGFEGVELLLSDSPARAERRALPQDSP
jgi:hypothetical protein